jgi:anti-sigma regulatory factor (Ser/Thr protein kinase)
MDLTPQPSDVTCVSVSIEDMTGAGEARRIAARLAEALQFSDSDAGRVALVVTEAATNIARHAGRGEILVRRMAMDTSAGIEILALDNGPGMANVAECMRDGFSTAGTRGVGIGAIARLSTTFDIVSAPGKGTALLSRIAVRPNRFLDSRLEWGAVCLPIRGEDVSGDAWAVDQAPGRSAIVVVDGVGHGLHAFDAAQEALRVFYRMACEGPDSFLRAADGALRGTRGAAAMAVDISWPDRRIRHAGVGNISGMLLRSGQKGNGLVSHPGTLGQATGRVRELTRSWPDKSLLVVHSDGLSSRWDLEAYPGLSQKDPSLIAGVLYRDFHARKDDVVVLVCRERDPGAEEAA